MGYNEADSLVREEDQLEPEPPRRAVVDRIVEDVKHTLTLVNVAAVARKGVWGEQV